MNTTQAVLSSAMTKNQGKPLRSELLDSWLRVLVEPFAISELINNSSQIVFGRRGSGKTMYFKALEEMLCGNPLLHRQLLVYVPVNELLVSSYEPSRSDPNQDAKHCFASLMESVGNKLLLWFDRITADETLARSFGLTKKSANELQETLLKFQYTVSHGNPVPGIWAGKTRMVSRSAEERSGEKGSSATAAATVDPKSILGTASLALKTSREQHNSESSESQFEAEHKIAVPTAELRRLAIQAVEQFGAKSLIVMIDEWPLLADAQENFAEYIRRAFCGHPRICVKIAADRFQCRLSSIRSDGKRRGLEIGADIFEAADLDMPLHGTDDALPLYAQMLVKRLTFYEPQMMEHFGPNIGDDPLPIVDLLFQNRHVFGELCNGAQGLARDFLELFRLCSKEIKCDARKRITSSEIHKVLLHDSHSVMRNVQSSEPATAALNGEIRNVVARSQQPFFFTDKGVVQVSSVLRTLLSSRAIHGVPQGYTKPQVSEEFDSYELDYSVYCEWRELLEWTKQDLRPLGDLRVSLRSLSTTEARERRVHFTSDDVARGRSIECPHCKKDFLSSAPAYDLKKLCPYCFEPIVDGK